MSVYILLCVTIAQLWSQCSAKFELESTDSKNLDTFKLLLSNELNCSSIVFFHDYDNISLPLPLMNLLLEHRGKLSNTIRVLTKPSKYIYVEDNFQTTLNRHYIQKTRGISYVSTHQEDPCALYYFSIRNDWPKNIQYFENKIYPMKYRDYFVFLNIENNINTAREPMEYLTKAAAEVMQNSIVVNMNDSEVTFDQLCWFDFEIENGSMNSAQWANKRRVNVTNGETLFCKFPEQDLGGANIGVYSFLYFDENKFREYENQYGGIPQSFQVIRTLSKVLNFNAIAKPPKAKYSVLGALMADMCDIALIRMQYSRNLLYQAFGRSFPFGFQSVKFHFVPIPNSFQFNLFYFQSSVYFFFLYFALAFCTFGVSIFLSQFLTRKLIHDKLPIEKLPIVMMPFPEFALPVLPSFRAARCALLFWFLGLILLFAGYFAVVYNYLTYSMPTNLPQSISELVKSTEYEIVYPVTSTSLKEFVYDSYLQRNGQYATDFMNYVHNEGECFKRVRNENVACINVENETPDLKDLIISKSMESMLLDFHYIDFKLKSILSNKFDRTLIRMWDSGLISRWEEMWKFRRAKLISNEIYHTASRIKPPHYDYRVRYTRLKITELFVPFLFLIISLSVCTGVFIAELNVFKNIKIQPMVSEIKVEQEHTIIRLEKKRESVNSRNEEDVILSSENTDAISELHYEALSRNLSRNDSDSTRIEEDLTVATIENGRNSRGTTDSEVALFQEIEGLEIHETLSITSAPAHTRST